MMKDDNNKRPYEIGYGKPPRKHRFPKGISGNPQGRPKKSRNIATLFREGMDQEVIITENGKKKKLTVREAIVQRALIDAMRGKDKAVERIMKIYARHFRAEEDLPAQAAKELDEWLDTLPYEELCKLIEDIRAIKAENKAKEQKEHKS